MKKFMLVALTLVFSLNTMAADLYVNTKGDVVNADQMIQELYELGYMNQSSLLDPTSSQLFGIDAYEKQKENFKILHETIYKMTKASWPELAEEVVLRITICAVLKVLVQTEIALSIIYAAGYCELDLQCIGEEFTYAYEAVIGGALVCAAVILQPLP